MNGKAHGMGTLKSAQTDSVYVGCFANDERSGGGRETFSERIGFKIKECIGIYKDNELIEGKIVGTENEEVYEGKIKDR